MDDPELPYAATVTPNKNAKRLSPGVLEGASAFLYLASTALLQSRNGIIKVFPAVPENFSGSFEKMLAENAIEVSSKMRNGKVTEVKLKSLYGGTCLLADPFADRQENLLTVELPPGKTIVLR